MCTVWFTFCFKIIFRKRFYTKPSFHSCRIFSLSASVTKLTYLGEGQHKISFGENDLSKSQSSNSPSICSNWNSWLVCYKEYTCGFEKCELIQEVTDFFSGPTRWFCLPFSRLNCKQCFENSQLTLDDLPRLLKMIWHQLIDETIHQYFAEARFKVERKSSNVLKHFPNSLANLRLLIQIIYILPNYQKVFCKSW